MAGKASPNDVLIAGGGIAGLALAAALSRTLKPFRVTVCDAALAREPAADDRVVAIAAGARKLLEAVGAWQRLTGPVQPIREMIITDSRLDDVVRPVFLTFEKNDDPDEPIAHMVENRDLLVALRDVAKEAGAHFETTAIGSFESALENTEARLANGAAIKARLLVAADGGRSSLRTQAGIKTVSWDYGQSGIVATIGHTRDHKGRAEEHFLPSGPFAILPLSGKKSSIVWTEPNGEAARLVALPLSDFKAELERRFGLKLGEIEVLSKPKAFPLGFTVARKFVADRLALLGDAAHVIHPIAGQGLNLGIRDAAALAECITDAARLGLDPGALEVLSRYERWRRFDTMGMSFATDGLNRLFSNNSGALKVLRDVGMGLVDRMPPLKNFFIKEAAGLTGDVPKLLRGEVL
jgi:2-octaprenyl-6-methoxyphenol hydroxylase